MKRIHFLICLVLFSLLMTSCREEDPLSAAGDATPLRLCVVADNFVSTGGSTRATEEGYVTKFAAEDQIGIFVVSATAGVLDKNIPYKYSGTAWVPVDAANTVNRYDNYLDDVTYFAYYPYSATMDDKKSEQEIIDAFNPQTDQSTYVNYTASDLMTGAGTLTGTAEGGYTLTLQLKHQMTLLVLCPDPYAKCVAPTNAGYEYYPESRTKGTVTNAKISNVGTYAVGDDTYRLIVKPGTMNVPLEYTLGTTVTSHTFTGLALTAGTYRRFNLGHAALTIEREMQIGDYFHNDGKLAPGADGEEPVNKDKCIGVVFHVGTGEGDALSDYSDTGLGLRDKIRGYVVALTDRKGDTWVGEPGTFIWSESENVTGVSTSTTDFRGYANTSLILQNATNPVAAQMSKDYSSPHGSPPSNSSGWYLGAVGQMMRITGNSKIKRSLEKAGGTDANGTFWTSTEKDERNAYITDGKGGFIAMYKTIGLPNIIRSVLTF